MGIRESAGAEMKALNDLLVRIEADLKAAQEDRLLSYTGEYYAGLLRAAELSVRAARGGLDLED